MSDDNVVSMAAHAAGRNRKIQGKVETMIGQVGNVTEMPDLLAVAFTVASGGKEKLFYISTEKQDQDGDYRKPLAGETVKIWFSDAAKTLDIGGEQAQGVVEIQNISNDSESKAFAWFKAKREGKPLPPAN